MGFPQNAYPNKDNFQAVSFPQEVIPPDVDTDVDVKCVRYNPAWAAVLASACDQLTQLSAWIGTPEEKKLAVSRATNLKIQLQEFEDCDMGCCYDTVAHRITADGEMEISINGGDWIPDPDDPRVGAVSYPPPVFDEHHTKCDAAENVNTHLNSVISQTSDQLGGTGSLLEIASVIALAIFALFIAPESIPALVPLILPLLSAILFLGQAAFDAYFDTTVHDQILCAIFCSIGDDGTFTDAQYTALLDRLGSDLPASPAKDYFIQIVGRIGLVGINDYAAIGTSADADCSDCLCVEPCTDLADWIGDLPGTLGTIISRDDTHIIVQTEFYTGFGGWCAGINSGHPENFDICCTLQRIEESLDSGATWADIGITSKCPCGSDFTTGGNNTSGGSAPILINQIIEVVGTIGHGTSQVKFTFYN